MGRIRKENIFENICSDYLSNSDDEVVDIITFMKSSWGLHFNSFSSQECVLKIFYGLELNDYDKTIRVANETNDKLIAMMSEREFLEYLIAEGKCNLKEVPKTSEEFRELVLVIGRRGSKCRYTFDKISTTVGIITFEELLKRKQCEKIGIITYNSETYKKKITYDFEIWDNGKRDCSKLVTKRGFEETSSNNHPYLIWRNNWEKPQFMRLDELKQGDRIAIAKSNNLVGEEFVDDVNFFVESKFDLLPIGIWNYIKEIKKEKNITKNQLIGDEIYDDKLIIQNGFSRSRIKSYGFNINDKFLLK